jgi:hypothetical protein
MKKKGSAPEETPVPVTCPSCGNTFAGDWCHACGERRRGTRDLSLRALAGDAWEALTDTDSRIWRTLRALLFSPGVLTRDWVEGRRRTRVAPLRLFLLANVVYFLSQSITGFNTFTTPLQVHLDQSVHSEIARKVVRSRMADREEDFYVFQARFNDAARAQAKSLIIVFAPFLALLLAAIEWRRRVPLAVHFVFALHFLAVLMLLASVLDPLLVALSPLVPGGFVDWTYSAVYIVLWAVYLFRAFRMAYGHGRVGSGAATLALLAGFVVLILGYRVLLFFTVFHTI